MLRAAGGFLFLYRKADSFDMARVFRPARPQCSLRMRDVDAAFFVSNGPDSGDQLIRPKVR